MKPFKIFFFCAATMTSVNAFASSPEPTTLGAIESWIEVLLGTPADSSPATTDGTDGNGREIKIEVPS